MNAPKTIKRRSINSTRIERWLGKEKVESLAGYMRNGGGPNVRWYGQPINLRDVPGSVWITPDGDFVGDFERGSFDSALDSFGRHMRSLWEAAGKPIYQPDPCFNVGFGSISAALLSASSGGSQLLNGTVSKTGPTGVVGSASTLWRVGAQPAAGSVGAAAPGGTVHVKTDTGAMAFNNPSSGTTHLTGADFSASVINNSVMLYDRLFSVAKTMNSSATEAVSGVPTRYTSTVTASADYVGGNFLFIEVGGTPLAATAHNWASCVYTNQAGTAAVTLPTVAGISGAIVDRFDMPLNTWFCPLATGDTGIKALTTMKCDAAVLTGVISFVIGHPIGIMSFPVISSLLPYDWLTNRNQAPRIFDNACLALFELPKPTTTATTYNGLIYIANAPP